MKPQPTAVEILQAEGEVRIRWNDGHYSRHSMNSLRKQCPCATCTTEREKMSAKGPVLRVLQTPGPAVTQAQVLEYSLVGRYALNFRWNDGHSTGIYAFDFLREHCTCPDCLPKS